jgi:hypothetical protein
MESRRFPLQAGQYYVVLDNVASAAPTLPSLPGILSPILGNDASSVVSYVAQVGE